MRKRSPSPVVDPSDVERVRKLHWSVRSSEPCEIRERADITFIIDPLDALVRAEGGELRKREMRRRTLIAAAVATAAAPVVIAAR